MVIYFIIKIYKNFLVDNNNIEDTMSHNIDDGIDDGIDDRIDDSIDYSMEDSIEDSSNNNLLIIRNYLNDLLNNDDFLNRVYQDSNRSNMGVSNMGVSNMGVSNMGVSNMGVSNDGVTSSPQYTSEFSFSSLRSRRRQRNNVYSLLSSVLGERNTLDFGNNSLDRNLTTFINSTLNQTAAYKKVASDDGLAQVESILYTADLNINNCCPIFFTDFTEGQLISKMPCNHCFDSGALETWLIESNVCPVCRFELKYKEIKITPDSDENVDNDQEPILQTNEEFEAVNDNSSISIFPYISALSPYISALSTIPNLNFEYSNNIGANIGVNMVMNQEELDFQEAIMQSLME